MNLPIPNPPTVIALPFTPETATREVRLAEDAWNSREQDRTFSWPAPGPRPSDHPGIPDIQ